jgi:hypothetical protein
MTSGPVRYRLTVLTEVVQVLQGVRLRRTGHRELDSDRELGRDTRVAARAAEVARGVGRHPPPGLDPAAARP